MSADFTIKQSDTAPVFTDTLTYSTGAPVTLTGATVAFVMRSLTAADDIALTGTTTVTSATLGTVQFAPSAADTATAGQYMANWKVTFSGGLVMTFPTVGYLSVTVEENITSAGGQQLVSIPDVKDYLNIPASDRTRDAKLARFIRAARPIVENITGPIIPAVFDEWHDGGGPMIQLRRRPSNSYATSALLTLTGTVDNVALGVTEYWGSVAHALTVVPTPATASTYSCMVDGLGTLTRLVGGGSVSSFYGPVHVVYQAGQSSIPPNVYEAVLELLRVNYERTTATGRGGSIVPVADEFQGGPPLAFYVPHRVREMLAPGRRAPAVA